MKGMRFLVRNGQRRKPHEPSIAQRVRREQLAPYSKPQVLFGSLQHQAGVVEFSDRRDLDA